MTTMEGKAAELRIIYYLIQAEDHPTKKAGLISLLIATILTGKDNSCMTVAAITIAADAETAESTHGAK